MKHQILFTGHMIDKPDREQKRFPQEKEEAVGLKIKEKLQEELADITGQPSGIASGACGGDILFHELCVKLGIPSDIYLALSPADFKKKSVSCAGEGWEKRFDNLIQKLPFRVLPILEENKNDNVWERTNSWMLADALKNAGENMTLIALWDGKAGDGDGGTGQMIKIATAGDARIKLIDITKL